MKHLLIALSILFIPASASAMTSPDFWFCKAVGHVDDKPVIYLTNVWRDNHANDYALRQKMFTEHIKKLTKGKFVPSFMSKCRDYVVIERAQKHRLLEIETAKRYKFQVHQLNWSFTPYVGKGKYQ